MVHCDVRDWDSAFFGIRIAQVQEHRLTREDWAELEQWCAREAIDCLYFLADSADPGTASTAEEAGFHLVDIRVTLDRRLPASGLDTSGIRPFAGPDLERLAGIARESHLDTRFYADGHFSRQRCDDLYETWIRNSCAGWADAVLVAATADRAAGYISCHLRQHATGSIGLLAVGSDAQGRGWGTRLIQGALAYFQEHACSSVEVVTQGRNIAAQRLYQGCGFRTKSLHLWYHRWFR